jgi:hypothetical protein
MMIGMLRERPSQSVLMGVTAIALVGMLVFYVAMRPDEAAMQAAGGYGIVNYELAFTAEQVDAILAAWGPDGQAAARHQLWLDYGLMPSYGFLFAGLVLMISRGLAGRIQSLGLALTPASLAAAVFDAIENVMLLSMLNGGAPGPALIAGVCTAVKFLLLVIVFLFSLIAVVAWMVGGRR